MARLEALQNENLQIMYPEYYHQQQNLGPTQDGQELNPDAEDA